MGKGSKHYPPGGGNEWERRAARRLDRKIKAMTWTAVCPSCGAEFTEPRVPGRAPNRYCGVRCARRAIASLAALASRGEGS